jgi:hypothetical protein
MSGNKTKLAFAVRMASSYNEMVQAVVGDVPTGQDRDRKYSFPWTPFEKGFGQMYDNTTVRIIQDYSSKKITISQEVDRNNNSLFFCNSDTLRGYFEGDNRHPNKPKVKIRQTSPETRDDVELDFMLKEKSQLEDGIVAIPTFCVERELKFEEDGIPYKFQTVMTLQKYPDGSSKIDDDILIKSISVSGKDMSIGRDDNIEKLAELLTQELDVLVTKGYGLFNDNIESVDDNGNITYTEDFIESGKKLKR